MGEPQSAPGATTPVEIELDREGGRLLFGWADGKRSGYPWELLRWKCPCAICSGEGGHPGMLASLESLSPTQVVMTDVELVGRYAVRPTWQDNHDTGIYTFRLLRELAETNDLFLES